MSEADDAAKADLLEAQVEAALDKARTRQHFLVLSNFSPDIRSLIEDFWRDGYVQGVSDIHLNILTNSETVRH